MNRLLLPQLGIFVDRHPKYAEGSAKGRKESDSPADFWMQCKQHVGGSCSAPTCCLCVRIPDFCTSNGDLSTFKTEIHERRAKEEEEGKKHYLEC